MGDREKRKENVQYDNLFIKFDQWCSYTARSTRLEDEFAGIKPPAKGNVSSLKITGN